MTVDTASSRVCLVRSLVSRDVQDILSIERESFATPWTQALVEAELQGNPFSRFLGSFPRMVEHKPSCSGISVTGWSWKKDG